MDSVGSKLRAPGEMQKMELIHFPLHYLFAKARITLAVATFRDKSLKTLTSIFALVSFPERLLCCFSICPGTRRV